jgi:hypothetical protein
MKKRKGSATSESERNNEEKGREITSLRATGEERNKRPASKER